MSQKVKTEVDSSAMSASILDGAPRASFGATIPASTSQGVESLPTLEALEPEKNHAATAYTVVRLVDTGCAMWTWPLDQGESADLQRDLEAVLRKYDMPDVPIAEEVALIVTTARIAIPRIKAKLAKGEDDDSDKSGQEGVGKNIAPAQAGMPQTPVAGSAFSIVS